MIRSFIPCFQNTIMLTMLDGTETKKKRGSKYASTTRRYLCTASLETKSSVSSRGEEDLENDTTMQSSGGVYRIMSVTFNEDDHDDTGSDDDEFGATLA